MKMTIPFLFLYGFFTQILKGVFPLRAPVSFVILLIVFLGFPSAGFSAPDPATGPVPEKGKTLVVGIDPIPPFAMRTEEGQWHGVSWAIWHFAATQLGWNYEIKRLPLNQIIPALRSGEIDVAATAYGITAEREAKVDFTVPYYFSAFGVATAKPSGVHALAALLKDVFSIYLLKTVLILTAVLLFVSTVFWLCERRKDRGQKKLGFSEGIWNAFMLSAETMTTVGYGENVPKSRLGRVVACIWMFLSIILLTYFMANVTSSLTAIKLQESLYDLDDLHRIRVGCLASPSRSALYLQRHGIKHQGFDTVRNALQALEERKLDAVVYDFSTLHYLIHKHYRGKLTVLNHTFNPKFFGLALPPNSPLRRPLNKAILEAMERPVWRHILESYIGKDAVPTSLPFVIQNSGQKEPGQ